MPNWFTPSSADLNDHKVAERVTALREEALGAGQTDPMPRLITEVTNAIRNAISFSGKYRLDATATTLPNGLKEETVKKIMRVMKGRLELPLSKDEERDDEIFESRLKALVKGEWPVDEPDTVLAPVPVQTASASPRITPRTRTFRREDGDGA